MWIVLIYSLIAGIVGTGIGGLIGIYFGRKSEKSIALLLAFAAGVLLSIVFFDLIPEAVELFDNVYFVALALFFGASLVFLFHLAIDGINLQKQANSAQKCSCPLHGEHQQEKNNNLIISGFVMLIAVSLHNFPAGIAIGAAGVHAQNVGLVLAILIGIHNIPEGVALISPLIAGGMSKVRAFLWILLAASTLVVGTVVGAVFGSLNDNLTAFFIAFAGGAMLYMTFAEIIPAALFGKKGKAPVLLTLIGILAGFVLVSVL